MRFSLFEFNFGRWPKTFWICALSVEWGDQERSLLHIERSGGIWKFQILWTKNGCWVW
jgi:hypothetical protein